ncbi:hypothetical protein M0R72_03010 [Candidatus Pacearchaeota archaeon]|jgi:hypothetical protein|nr:hypothetical protein [Candidatus Pacearchaeota archaeon]
MPLIDDRLETDWDSFKELWADVTKFMEEHPTHVIIPADDPNKGRYGWVAFIETMSLNIDDEQAKEWTIQVSIIRKEAPEITEDLFTNEGRLKMCRVLCEGRFK